MDLKNKQKLAAVVAGLGAEDRGDVYSLVEGYLAFASTLPQVAQKVKQKPGPKPKPAETVVAAPAAAPATVAQPEKVKGKPGPKPKAKAVEQPAAPVASKGSDPVADALSSLDNLE